MKVAIITGSAGLIGSQACDFFSEKGYKIKLSDTTRKFKPS